MSRMNEILGLEEIDLRSNILTKIDIDSCIPTDLEKTIKDLEQNIGVILTVKKITSGESFVKAYYKNKGYSVHRMEPSRYNIDRLKRDEAILILDYLQQNFKLAKGNHFNSFKKFFDSPGVPDFLCVKYNKEAICELFFVEVKNESDSLRYSQLFWACSSNVPFRVVFCKSKKSNGKGLLL